MKKLKNIYIVLLFCLFIVSLMGQGNIYEVAHAGDKGIFVTLGVDLISEIHPLNNAVGYKIKRRQENSNKWQTLAFLSAPGSIDTLINRINRLNKILPIKFNPEKKQLNYIWERIYKYGRLDSLGFWSNLLTLRLAAGATYFDQSAIEKTKYQYRISLVDKSHNSIKSILSNIITYPEYPKLAQLHFINSINGTKTIQQNWTIGKGKNPSAVLVFRKELNEKDFTKVDAVVSSSINGNKINLTIQDTTISPNLVYQYYLRPLDYYGNPGENSKTIIVGSYNFRQIPLPQNINAVSSDSLGGIYLKWKLQESPLIQSVIIYRSNIYDSLFTELGEVVPAQKWFVDLNAEPMKKYFYYLKLRGPLSEISAQSAKVFSIYEDSNKPLPPYGLLAKPISNGVELTWNKNDNYIKGYYVYRNSTINDTLYQISDLIISQDSVILYKDTSKTLSAKYTYTYAVKSENTSHALSPFSDSVSVRPGKYLRPKPPSNLTIFKGDSSAKIYWSNSEKLDNTIYGYNIFRREFGNNKFQKINDTLLSLNHNFYVDTTIQIGKQYQFAVKSISIFNSESNFSRPVDFLIDIPIPISPSGLRAVNENEGIRISWESVLADDIIKYNIYRYQRGVKVKMIGSVRADELLQFVDPNTVEKELYFYQITAVNKYKKESMLDSEVGITRQLK